MTNTPADTLLATVTICTRNRAESLARTLGSVVEAARSVHAPWELLVVDNGSTDHTAEVVARFSDRLPIRRVTEPVPGLSNARNAGIAAARGQFVIWTDDDVLVDENWLEGYVHAFTRYPETGIFGGRAIPRYEAPQQDWFIRLEPHMIALLAIRDRPDWTEMIPGRLPFGLNYAVSLAVQRRFPYDPALGVAPGRRIGGEETGMIKRALAEGVTGRWVWDATVYHLITPERQTLDYVYSYYHSQGLLYAKVPVGTHKVRRLAYSAYLAARRAKQQAIMRLQQARGDDRWILSYMEYARLCGYSQRLRDNNIDFA